MHVVSNQTVVKQEKYKKIHILLLGQSQLEIAACHQRNDQKNKPLHLKIIFVESWRSDIYVMEDLRFRLLCLYKHQDIFEIGILLYFTN